MKKICLIILFLLIPYNAWSACTDSGTDLYPDTCSYADVNACVTAANDGDTIHIPAGNCTDSGLGGWTSGITFCKGITIAGAGEDQTFIQDKITKTDSWYDTPFFIAGCSGNKTIEISGIYFTDNNQTVGGQPYSDATISIISEDSDYIYPNIHDITFDGVSRAVMAFSSYIQGVIHNITVDTAAKSAILVKAKDEGMNTVWASSDTIIGASRNLFIEDSSFTDCSDGALDVTEGGKAVFRYNTCEDAMVGTHGYDSVDRAGLNMEVYNNTFTCTDQCDQGIGAIQYRGGNGVVFGNTIETGVSGYQTPYIALTNYRSRASGDCCFVKGCCNGTDSEDENTSGYYGWRCLDQVGTINPSSPGSISSSPLYVWDNNSGAVVASTYDNCEGTSYVTTHIVSGRDYINGTQRPSYSPYTYPHPYRTDVNYYICQTGTTCCGELDSASTLTPAQFQATAFNPGDAICFCDAITSKLIFNSSGSINNPIKFYGNCQGHIADLQAGSASAMDIRSSHLELHNIAVTGTGAVGSLVWVSPNGSNLSDIKFYNIEVSGGADIGMNIRTDLVDAQGGFTIDNIEIHDSSFHNNDGTGLHIGGYGEVSNVIVYDSVAYSNGTAAAESAWKQGISIVGYSRVPSWTSAGSNKWYDSYSIGPSEVTQNGRDATTQKRWTEVTGSCPSVIDENGEFCYDSVNDRTYIYYTSNPNSFGSCSGDCWVLFYGNMHDNDLIRVTAYGNIGDSGLYYDNGAHDGLIDQCIVYGQLQNNYSQGGWGINLRAADNVVIRNSLIYNNESIGIRVYDQTTGTQIYNNSFYGNPYDISLENYNGGTVAIRNNIFSSYTSYAIADEYTSNYTETEDYNQFYKSGDNDYCSNINGCTQTTVNTHDQIGDPLYTNPTTDFTIQSGSPCKDSGDNSISASVGSYDLAGNSRIYNTTIDRGAYEVQSGADTTNPVITITNPATDPYYTYYTPLSLSGTTTDNIEVVAVTYGCNGCTEPTNGSAVLYGSGTSKTWILAGINLTASATGTCNTPNTLTVTAYDAAINYSTDSVVICYTLPPDDEDPVVEITDPSTDPYITKFRPINISGTATDDDDVVLLTLNCSTCTPTYMQISDPDESFTFYGLLLADGQNDISITATDTNYNNGSDSIVIHYRANLQNVTLNRVTLSQ